MHKKPKPATDEQSGRKTDAQPVSSTTVSSASAHVQTSTAEGRHQGQQQASSTTQYAPVPVPRRSKVNEKRSQPAEAENDSERKREEVGQVVTQRQNQVKGEQHRDNRRNKSDSSSNRDDDEDDDGDVTEQLTDNDDDVTSGSSSSSKSEDNVATKLASYPVRWIGSAPIGSQLSGKQRSDTFKELTAKLSSAVESLGRVSSLCSVFSVYITHGVAAWCSG